ILNRKLDQITGPHVPDTNTKDDWMQDDDPIGTATPPPNDRENDDISAKKLLRPGWAITNPDYEDIFATKKFNDTNGTTTLPVYFFDGCTSTGDDNYRFNNVHAKIMVVDGQWVLTGSDNFSSASMTNDNKANGTAGERGGMIITNAPDVVSYTMRLINFDFQP